MQAIALGWKAAKLNPDPSPRPAESPPIAEMQAPIDRLYAAWRNLDAEAYVAQWAPEAVKINLKTGARQTMRQLAADRITLFQRSIEEDCESEDEVVVAIGETLIHELGHYFGMSEEEIMEIEERYWRGEGS